MKLQHFKDSEFRGQINHLSPLLLYKIDNFREILGQPLIVSPAPGAIYREGKGTSQHYFGNAIDLMSPSGVSPQYLVDCAMLAGFSGIGYYPHWLPHQGVHVDVRPPKLSGAPSLWGGVRNSKNIQVYVSITEAIRRGDML